MRIIIVGPTEFEDFKFVRKTLDNLTFELRDVVLITDLRPERETHIEYSSFPIALKWLNNRWHRSRDKTKYKEVVAHYAPYTGNKKWSQGVKEQRLKMVQDASGIIAFWDVGNVDDHTQEVFDLAKFYDLKLKKVLI